MCIFSVNIESVSSTNIFARIKGQEQLLVYEMYLSTEQETAMVLPIPIVPGTQKITFHDLSGFPTFFQKLEGLFPAPRGRGRGVAVAAGPPLEVERVGAFDASFVPQPADFGRLDPRFRLSPTVLKALPQYKDYGFAVFQLAQMDGEVHPMAFSFPTRDTSKLYFPTVHVHDGQVHEKEDFSHGLYGQGDLVSTSGVRVSHNMANGIFLQDIAFDSKDIVSDKEEVFKQSLYGRFENKDQWFELN